MDLILKMIGAIVIVLSAVALCEAQSVDDLLLKNYRPQSIYKIPITKVEKAKYPVIDMHSHDFGKDANGIQEWIKMMDKFGIEKTIVMTQATGSRFDSLIQLYSPYGNRFQLWCGFDYTGYNESGWVDRAVAELVRCFNSGAKGVGELGDKGLGELYSDPVPAYGMHLDDVRLRPLFKKCAELKMPVNIHIAEPMWMYEKMDSTNDGLMNAYEWAIPKKSNKLPASAADTKLLNHAELIKTLENTIKNNRETTFIACHLANCEYDLSILGDLLEKYSNLYADISARYAETAPIPRYMKSFYQKYQDRLLYGTDMKFENFMYETTFRILQTDDEHFYAIDLTGYHWPLQGFGLSDKILKKLYKTNAMKIIKP